MSAPIQFESSWNKKDHREEKRKHREGYIEKLKSKYEHDEWKKEQAKLRGEDTWMLPSVSDRVDQEEQALEKSKKSKKSKKKAEKKAKKAKKQKKKRKHGSSSESDTDSDSVPKWTEKTKDESQTASITVKGPQLQRESWMMDPGSSDFGALPSISKTDFNEQRKKEKQKDNEEDERLKMMLEQPGQHEKELNPYWKEGGLGLPEEDPTKKTKPKQVVSANIAAGDGGASWWKKSYQRCVEQAKEEGRSLEDVAAERYGSLKKLEANLATAEKNQRKILDAEREKERDSRRDKYQDRHRYTDREKQESNYQKDEKSREDVSRKRSVFMKPSDNDSDNERQLKRYSDDKHAQPGWKKREFLKPGDQDRVSNQDDSQSNSKEYEPKKRTFMKPGDLSNRDSGYSQKGSHSPPRWKRKEYRESDQYSREEKHSRTRDGSQERKRSKSRERSRSPKNRHQGRGRESRSRSRERSRERKRSKSRERSRSPKNRHQRRGRESRSMSRDRSRERKRSKSRERSRSPKNRYQRRGRESRSRSRDTSREQKRSKSRDRSRSPKNRHQRRGRESRSRSRDRSRSPGRRKVQNKSETETRSKDTKSPTERRSEDRKTEERKRRISSSSADSESSETSSSGEGSGEEAVAAQVVRKVTPRILTEQELNELGAKMVRAELMGNEELAAQIKSQIDQARQARESQANAPAVNSQDTEKDEDDDEATVVLTRTDRSGMVRPLPSSEQPGSRPSRRRKEKVKTHGPEGRERYFHDDDNKDLKSLVEQERLGTAEDSNYEFVKLAGKALSGRDKEEMDEFFMQGATKKSSSAKEELRDRSKAIGEHKKMAGALDKCQHCFDKVPKHLIIAIGLKVYLCLPNHRSMTEGHCLIVPMQHVTQSTILDEDIFEEIQVFRRALTKMFSLQDLDCVFMETCRYLQHQPHMAIECVPMEKELGDMAPIYFKKALQESESEWSQNKKVVDLSQKNIRKSVPKGFPYFAVDFGLQGGFAHVIEDEKTFPFYFGREVVGGMLDLEPTLWRKPHKEGFEEQRKKVLKFAEWWKPVDWTQKLRDAIAEDSD